MCELQSRKQNKPQFSIATVINILSFQYRLEIMWPVIIIVFIIFRIFSNLALYTLKYCIPFITYFIPYIDLQNLNPYSQLIRCYKLIRNGEFNKRLVIARIYSQCILWIVHAPTTTLRT